MSMRLSGLLAAGGLVGAVAIGCSSSSGGTPGNDGGLVRADSGVMHLKTDAASVATPTDDGTTGMACKQDSDCQMAAGVNVCSNAFVTTSRPPSQLWGTPVCIKPLPRTAGTGNCDPTDPMNDPMGQFVHFCDGPDDLTAPGFCLANDVNQPLPNQGVCLPKCTFMNDGTAATGCAKHDACIPFTYILTTGNTVVGVGFCLGSCLTDTDCEDLPAPSGDGGSYHCQTDTGYCTTTPIAKRTKNIGDACSNPATGGDTATGACNCASGATNVGFCTSRCVVGGPACPNNWICDPGEPATLTFTDQANKMTSFPGKATQGAIGICTPACASADAAAPTADASAPAASDAATDGSSAPAPEAGPVAPAAGCPPNATCQAGAVVGSTCTP